LLERRLRHEPVAYLVNHQAFYGLDFYVDPRVLIPRPETELLVEQTLRIADWKLRIGDCDLSMHNSQLNIVDVGAGSGCIAITLAVHLENATIYAVDASDEALAVARINMERHGVADRICLVYSDLLANLDSRIQFDVIVANLPYVSEPELAGLPASVRDYEPVAWALAAGPDGLDLMRRLLDQARARLKPGGVILLEIGAAQGTAASALTRHHFPQADVRVLQDLAGLDRVVEVGRFC
jgi:release factor glutamine methyltransferase